MKYYNYYNIIASRDILTAGLMDLKLCQCAVLFGYETIKGETWKAQTQENYETRNNTKSIINTNNNIHQEGNWFLITIISDRPQYWSFV